MLLMNPYLEVDHMHPLKTCIQVYLDSCMNFGQLQPLIHKTKQI